MDEILERVVLERHHLFELVRDLKSSDLSFGFNLIEKLSHLNLTIDGNPAHVFVGHLLIIREDIIDERQDSLHILFEKIQARIGAGVESVADLRLALDLVESVHEADNRVRNVVHVDTRRVRVEADSVESRKMNVLRGSST